MWAKILSPDNDLIHYCIWTRAMENAGESNHILSARHLLHNFVCPIPISQQSSIKASFSAYSCENAANDLVLVAQLWSALGQVFYQVEVKECHAAYMIRVWKLR